MYGSCGFYSRWLDLDLDFLDLPIPPDHDSTESDTTEVMQQQPDCGDGFPWNLSSLMGQSKVVDCQIVQLFLLRMGVIIYKLFTCQKLEVQCVFGDSLYVVFFVYFVY